MVAAPGSISDPVPAPSTESLGIERGRLGRKARSEMITQALVDRIEATYADQVDATVLAWLKERPEMRAAFWLAIDPTYDHVSESVAMLKGKTHCPCAKTR